MTPFKKSYKKVEWTMQPILHGWLQAPKNGMRFRSCTIFPKLTPQVDAEANDFKRIRLACLPEILIAYNSILNFSSHFAGRDILKTSMDLAVLIAGDDSDLAACLVESERMPELMDSIAVVAKSMIVADAKKPSRARKDGRTLGLWSLEPEERLVLPGS